MEWEFETHALNICTEKGKEWKYLPVRGKAVNVKIHIFYFHFCNIIVSCHWDFERLTLHCTALCKRKLGRVKIVTSSGDCLSTKSLREILRGCLRWQGRVWPVSRVPVLETKSALRATRWPTAAKSVRRRTGADTRDCVCQSWSRRQNRRAMVW